MMLTSHPRFKHFPFGRTSPLCVDVPAIVDALCEVEHEHNGKRAILLDVKETEDAVEISADIPGVAKEDIDVDLNKNVLTLRVDHEQKMEESYSGDGKYGVPTWHRSERSSTFVKRSVRLPESADTAAGAASYSDGVLAIRFPKKALPSPTKLTIQ